MNNDAIQEDVLHELSCDPRMTSSHIAVTVKEAVVALSDSFQLLEKLEAEKAVKPVRGLRGGPMI
jgi:osmotically-inducible protein OsmY